MDEIIEMNRAVGVSQSWRMLSNDEVLSYIEGCQTSIWMKNYNEVVEHVMVVVHGRRTDVLV